MKLRKKIISSIAVLAASISLVGFGFSTWVFDDGEDNYNPAPNNITIDCETLAINKTSYGYLDIDQDTPDIMLLRYNSNDYSLNHVFDFYYSSLYIPKRDSDPSFYNYELINTLLFYFVANETTSVEDFKKVKFSFSVSIINSLGEYDYDSYILDYIKFTNPNVWFF